MRKTKIDWCDSTWNPVTGCNHGCPYCYARQIANRFSYEGETLDAPMELQRVWIKDNKGNPAGTHVLRYKVQLEKDGRYVPYPFGFAPTFHKYRLDECMGKAGRNIFVCSMADLFGDWVPDPWIEEAFNACEKARQHNYLFLTKNPKRYCQLDDAGKLRHKEDWWYGSSWTKPGDCVFAGGVGAISDRFNTFLSIEPMMEGMDLTFGIGCFNWVIIGAETGRRKGKVIPKREWIESIVEYCGEHEIPVFMKSSLEDIWGKPLIQEHPKGMGNQGWIEN